MINGVPRILLIRMSAIGDVVRVLPALHAIRDQYPTAQLDFAVERKSAAILEHHPALDKLWVFERSGGKGDFSNFRSFAQELRKERYDIALDFHGIGKTGLLTAWTRAKRRIGFAAPRSQEFSWLFYNERVKLVSRRMNRIEENLELAKAVDARRHHIDVEIQVPDEVREEMRDYLHQQFEGAKKVVAVHVPVDRQEKQWPLRHFVELCDLLMGDGRFDVLLTYGPGQHHLAEEVHLKCKRKPEVAPGLPDLKHYCALVAEVDMFVGGDTGPMHIASAMGTPVVAVFGGTDPQMHGPMRAPHMVLYAGVAGAGKAVDRQLGPELMGRISGEQVYDACVALAYGEKRSHRWDVGEEEEPE